MTQYDFRLRFNFANAFRISSDEEELELLALPNGEHFRLRTAQNGTPIKDHPRAAVLGGPFASHDAARLAAEKAKVALLYWAIEKRVGIDFGDGRPRIIFTDDGLAWLREQHRGPVRIDVHGIDVYERVGKQIFIAIDVAPKLDKHAPGLIQTFEQEFVSARQFTDKQILASEIYSGSFFDVSPRSRFITLVTAVEALLELSPRSEPTQTLVSELEIITRDSIIDDATKESIIGSFQWLRSESIGQSGRALTRRLLPDQNYDGRSSSSFFTYCYNLRSQILHRGAVADSSVDILQLANTMETFVSQLLLAALKDAPDPTAGDT